MSAYVSIRQHTSAYVSMSQHSSAFVSIRQHSSAQVRTRQHTSAYVSIRQHTSAYVSILLRLLSTWYSTQITVTGLLVPVITSDYTYNSYNPDYSYYSDYSHYCFFIKKTWSTSASVSKVPPSASNMLWRLFPHSYHAPFWYGSAPYGDASCSSKVV
jgi:hypothetical protein